MASLCQLKEIYRPSCRADRGGNARAADFSVKRIEKGADMPEKLPGPVPQIVSISTKPFPGAPAEA